jgi:hypothetical protein
MSPSHFSRQFRGEPPSAYRGRDHTAMAPVPACVARTWTRPGWLGTGRVEPGRVETSTIGEAPRGAAALA